MNDDELIFSVIEKIDWQRIKYIHNVLNIKWVSDDENEVYEHEPAINELKEELFIIMKFVVSKNIHILECGNWLVVWNDEARALKNGLEGPRLEAFFTIAESYATYSCENIELLQILLQNSIDDENYENAAKIRDKINSLSKNV